MSGEASSNNGEATALPEPSGSTLPFPVAASTVAPGSVPVLPIAGAPPPPLSPQPAPTPLSPTPPPPPTSGAPVVPDRPSNDSDVNADIGAVSHVADHSGAFVPLRSDPPPRLLATWWLRYLLLLTMTVCIAVVVMTEYAIGPGGVAEAPLVIASHVLAAVLLVAWSVCAMFDADRLVPATRYHRGSSCTVAASTWIGAFAAPIGFVAVLSRARTRFDQADGELQAVSIAIGAGVFALVLVWLPFGYLAGQARRIGAPRRVVVLWFFGSLLAAVGSAAIVILGLNELLEDAGVTALERAVQTAVIYGVPAFVFALSTWRATTVFDEVIDIRWRRWRTEWEMTLLALATQPAPGPELADQRRDD